MLDATKTDLWIARPQANPALRIRVSLFRSACLAVCGSMASLLFFCVFGGCQVSRTGTHVTGPAIEFTSVPVAGEPNAAILSTIEGRVSGARPEQQIVLYARAINDDGQVTWFVQPLVREPFTTIQSNSRWRNSTHPGSEYAALLVEPGFQPPGTTRVLPTQGVVAVAITKGWPPIWQRWWCPLVCVIVTAAVIFGMYRVWHYQVTKKLNLRFEERLGERMRVAQELHDTLLQGVLSASMQLHVAVDQLPPESPVRPGLDHVLQLMGQVIDEGRTTLRGLRSSIESAHDLGSSFSKIPQEFGNQQGTDFRVIVRGPTLALQPGIHNEVYRIGREALLNAFRHSRASNIEVELEYAAKQLRILVRDNGCGIDPQVVQSGRNGHWGLPGMRERAERIGAKLKVWSRSGEGTEVELRVPSDIAFESHRSTRASSWLRRLYRGNEPLARTRGK